jgi:hypothetical protein
MTDCISGDVVCKWTAEIQAFNTTIPYAVALKRKCEEVLSLAVVFENCLESSLLWFDA